MLYLNHNQIMKALTLDKTMDCAEQALRVYESHRFVMPERMTLGCGDNNVLIVMPSVADGAIAAKVLTLYPGNRGKGRPVIDAVVVLADHETGQILALMEGKTITSMRTGAVTGVSIRYLAKASAASVGLVGCGVQGYYQILYACSARNIRHICLFDVSYGAAEALKNRLAKALPEVEIQIADSTRALIVASDIVITATTASKPVFPDDPALFEGRHFVAIGSFQPEVREYPDAIFSRVERVWMDLHFAAEESGELLTPLQSGILRSEQLETLGHLIVSGEEPRRGRFGTTFFKTVGMALFDLAAAQEAYRSAVEGGLGTQL